MEADCNHEKIGPECGSAPGSPPADGTEQAPRRSKKVSVKMQMQDQAAWGEGGGPPGGAHSQPITLLGAGQADVAVSPSVEIPQATSTAKKKKSAKGMQYDSDCGQGDSPSRRLLESPGAHKKEVATDSSTTPGLSSWSPGCKSGADHESSPRSDAMLRPELERPQRSRSLGGVMRQVCCAWPRKCWLQEEGNSDGDDLSSDVSPKAASSSSAACRKVYFDDRLGSSWFEWSDGLPSLHGLPESGDAEQMTLRLCCVTWNLRSLRLTGDLGEFLAALPIRHHVYAIGFCECGPGSMQDELLTFFGEEYRLLAERAMWGIRLAVLVHRSVAPLCKEASAASVATGVANVAGNKGGVQVQFLLGRSRFLFISCHLAAGTDLQHQRRRNADLGRILLRSGCTDMQFDHLFLLGDINSRSSMSREDMDEMLATGQLELSLEKDELLRRLRMESARAAEIREHLTKASLQKCLMDEPGPWPLFDEAPICFPPTYKLNAGTLVYDTSPKRRVPSWTDRVLWRRSPRVKALRYGVLPALRRSDHIPVFAQFEVTADRVARE
eukprot:TRINITY_DN10037_c0_g1_i6.p1 TRINITY_DN10037_c0_g1~~TRINITY_DN10037_c0_g1_i6.p1  ORF type:complete len:554 (-),score=101.71 TRINITY_DN10037_c0_g1_i6:205-1866(-)